MSLKGNVALRKKQKEERERKIKEIEDILIKPQKSYLPSTRTLAIVFVILVIISLVYGYFSMDVKVKTECGLMPGIDCDDLMITGSSISMEVSNHLKEDKNITIKVDGCDDEQSQLLKPNTKGTYVFGCSNSKGIINKGITITHVGYSGLPHSESGFIRGKLEK
ncbi:MAG: hypothetical protein V1729_00035 [Candidatus Woesearchaeota archaeon]